MCFACAIDYDWFGGMVVRMITMFDALKKISFKKCIYKYVNTCICTLLLINRTLLLGISPIGLIDSMLLFGDMMAELPIDDEFPGTAGG